MPTKTTCRIASDVDLLSRVQHEEVITLLKGAESAALLEFSTPDTFDYLKDSSTTPNSPARLAILMTSLVERECDALVLDAIYLPSTIPSGLTIGAITKRLTPYDALICSEELILDELPENAVVAANEPRREAQILYYRSDLKVVHARGSLDSLVQKVGSGKIDAAIIAAADMERLGKQDEVAELLTNSVCIPAAGQGALAVLVRSDEEQFKQGVRPINHAGTYSELRAEMAFLDHIGLNGADPVAVLAQIEGNVLELEGMLASPDGNEKIHCVVKGSLGQEDDLGRTLAEEILNAGGREILQELHLL